MLLIYSFIQVNFNCSIASAIESQLSFLVFIFFSTNEKGK